MVARDKEDLSGQQIGNYEIESHIAARKASDLFLARDVKLERLVFLEVLRVTGDEDEDLVERFYTRMETVSQLKDPAIAVVSDIDVTEDGYPYAVIDYFPYRTLADKIAILRGDVESLPVIESLGLVKRIAQGLGVAHEAGLIHHDLRPENIMLREDGSPVLIDLGVPLVTGYPAPATAGADDAMLGYAAPEETEGKPLTERSNIYSLGIILYELLAGHRPNLPNLPFDIFPHANMPKEEPLEEARPGLAGETYRLVRNCLWRQEWSRFETTDEMITAIETAVFAEQELPKAAAWSAQRSRSMAVYIVPVALILVGILGFFLLRGLFGSNSGGQATPAGTNVAVVETADPNATPTGTPTPELPTESAGDFSISVLFPGPFREFGMKDTINFDWMWPTVLEPGRHFAVYLLDGEQEYKLGALTEPNNGAVYRLQVPAAELPVTGTGLAWQIRLESVDGDEVFVASDLIPISIRPLEAEATATQGGTDAPPSETPSATPTVVCVVEPPAGWVAYTIRNGDSLSKLAERADIPVETLLEVNCLPNDSLSIGQQVWVPQAALPPTSAPPPSTNTPAPPPPTSAPITTAPPPATSAPPATSVPTTAPTAPPATDVPPTDIPPTEVPPTLPPG